MSDTLVPAKRANILIVDDTPDNLDLLGGLLRQWGCRVRPVPGGRLALQAARKEPPDLVLLDVNMPEMNGYEVCQQLKADEALKAIPVIFISALTDTTDKVRGFSAGGVDYVTKPFQAEEVRARVETHLELQRLRKEMEQRNFSLEDLVAQKVREISEAQEREREHEQQLYQASRLSALGTLVSGIGHEINNPNNFIRLNSQNLAGFWKDIRAALDTVVRTRPGLKLRGIPYETARGMVDDLLEGIAEGSRRIEKLLVNLRDFASGDEGTLDQAVDLNAVVKSAMVIIDSNVRKSTSRFLFCEASALPPVRGNYYQLEQVVINLVNNACQALPSPEKAVRVETQRESDGRVALRVEDEGVGIPEKDIQHLLDPFFTTRRGRGGSGLGLAMTSRIIQNHGGTIAFASEVRQGHRGNGTVPCLHGGRMSHLNPAEPVLVVDDEELTRRSVRTALLQDGITNIMECRHGQEVRERIPTETFAAVILDLSIPGLPGEEVLRLLLEERPETPVIVATATNNLETAVRCMRAGAFDYLTKPVDQTRLLASVHHAIERWETAREMRSLKTTELERPEAFRRHHHVGSADAAGLSLRGSDRSHDAPGSRHRRNGNGQGARGARHSFSQRAQGELRDGQRRGPRRHAVRRHAFRPREGSLYRRGFDTGRGRGQGGGRHPFPGRDR